MADKDLTQNFYEHRFDQLERIIAGILTFIYFGKHADFALSTISDFLLEFERRAAGTLTDIDMDKIVEMRRTYPSTYSPEWMNAFGTVRNHVGIMQDNIRLLNIELHEFLAVQSMGIDGLSVPLSRFLPLRIYISDDDRSALAGIQNSVMRFINALGFLQSDAFRPERGSWFTKWFAKSKTLLTHEQVVERLQKAEHAIQLACLDQRQADIDKTLAEATNTLLGSLESSHQAACQIGSLLIVKRTTSDGLVNTSVRTLTASEMIFLERNQNLLKRPDDILDCLTGAKEVDALPPAKIESNDI